MEGDEFDYDPQLVESLQLGLQFVDLKAQEDAYLEDRRKREALRARRENPGMTLAEIIAKREAEEAARADRALKGWEPVPVNEPEKKPDPIKAGRFPAPPMGVKR